ncbi:muellerian-inhibiting factor isoform X1 [Tachysurus fulvidraco]|uniref:muellerian-inhibiting factor isoform X1 n=1 Tax=Tachysurus fulvidraco TaxID=1234273 RepID=UPI000F5101A2|nr:muellerian-inhibiting factor isoform X1 [Tachysurus fulvidraco]
MGAKMCFWMLLLLPVTVVTGPLDETRTETERNQHEDFIRVQSLSGQNRSEREGQVPSEGPDASAPRRLLKDVPCVVEGVHHHPEALHEILLALQNVWSKDGEAKEREFGRFGFCSHDDGVRYSQFSSLMKENKSPEYTHSEKEHLDAEKDGTFTMTLHFAKPATCSEQTTTASIMLLFFIDFCNTEEMKIQFSSQDLQPNNQTACVSQATRFLVLTGIRSNSFGHENIKLRMDVQQDGGKKLGLSKFQAITSWRKSRSESPVILLFPKKSVSENVPQSNGTFLFLCELQKFLNEVSPQGNPLLQDEVRTISPNVLRSLPPLTLGVSSSESLLRELVNSSGPTVFFFPQSARLRTHRVELALKPSLRSVLKLKLDETLAQARMEEFGRGAMDKLEVLSVLSTLSVDGEDLETGLEEQREVQYRALLLLKALQAVLGAWAVERAQRAARDSQDGPTRVTQCHLESFTVSLEKYLLEPATANINNCEGACGFPLNNGNNHAILLNSHLQSGQPLKRGICCVPVAYDDLCVIELNSDSTTISYKTDMIAKECGCR